MRGALRWIWAKRWRRWVAIGSALFVAASVGGVEATSQSGFCKSCHIMEPYYTSWKHGTHKDVKCVKCHIEPGATSFVAAKLNGLGQVVDDVLNRTSPKPSASVSQLSCTRSGCHSVENLSSREVDNGIFKFKHSKHLGAKHLGVELSCGTCHSHVKGDQHFEVNTGVCITCHLIEHEPGTATLAEEVSPGRAPRVLRMAVRRVQPQSLSGPAGHAVAAGDDKHPPNDCTVCHDAPEGEFDYNGLKIDHAEFASYGAACTSCHRGVTATPPAIEDGACLECHAFGIEKSLSTHEMHQVHSLGRHKIECFSCHGSIQHGIDAQAMSFQQFDCRQCHVDQHAVQRRAYLSAEDVPAHATLETAAVNPMFLAHVDCNGCHIETSPMEARPGSGATVSRASAAACDACHQAGLGEQMIPLWQEATKKLFEQAETELAALRPRVASEPTRRLVAEAESLINLVRIDGSWGVHNPKYTQRLLEQAREKLNAARAEVAGSGGS